MCLSTVDVSLKARPQLGQVGRSIVTAQVEFPVFRQLPPQPNSPRHGHSTQTAPAQRVRLTLSLHRAHERAATGKLFHKFVPNNLEYIPGR